MRARQHFPRDNSIRTLCLPKRFKSLTGRRTLASVCMMQPIAPPGPDLAVPVYYSCQLNPLVMDRMNRPCLSHLRRTHSPKVYHPHLRSVCLNGTSPFSGQTHGRWPLRRHSSLRPGPPAAQTMAVASVRRNAARRERKHTWLSKRLRPTEELGPDCECRLISENTNTH